MRLTPEGENMSTSDNIIERLHNKGATTSSIIEMFVRDLYKHNIQQKCRDDRNYCQALYAALCNNIWSKHGYKLMVSWRYAAGLIAELEDRNGDYMDWYCSGIGGSLGVPEGNIMQEILEDMMEMGWFPEVDNSR